MMTKFYQALFLFLIGISFQNIAAQDTIRLRNPSFEDDPKNSVSPKGWLDCGFEGETPPDVQPGGGYEVSRPAVDGMTYLGMVCRDNRTNEKVSTRLSREVIKDQCYRFSIKLCRSDFYRSNSRKTKELVNYLTPISAEIWLGNSYCERAFLAGTTKPIEHSEWQEYFFEFEPTQNYKFILIQAGSDSDLILGKNGNLLIDDASDIIAIECKE
jgi:hypothetical protein